MTFWKKRTPELARRAAEMRTAGMTLTDIAKVLGLRNGTTVRVWLEPTYRERRRKSDADRRAGIFRQRLKPHSNTPDARDAARLMKEIPPDTRDLTARLCGDPIPGRRAIDKREMQRGKHEVPFQ